MSGSYRSAIWKTQLALLICGSLPGCKDTTASVEGPRRIVRRQSARVSCRRQHYSELGTRVPVNCEVRTSLSSPISISLSC